MSGDLFSGLLPVGCPPEEAVTDGLDVAFRLVPSSHPTEQAFESFAVLKGKRPEYYNCTDCEWASCSLSNDPETLLSLAKLKGLRRRNPYMARLAIPPKKGSHLIKGSHIDFWKFPNFFLSSTVVATWEHGR